MASDPSFPKAQHKNLIVAQPSNYEWKLKSDATYAMRETFFVIPKLGHQHVVTGVSLYRSRLKTSNRHERIRRGFHSQIPSMKHFAPHPIPSKLEDQPLLTLLELELGLPGGDSESPPASSGKASDL